ncbi:MAG: ABC transporter permease subunit [Candidatus Vecturithrix sp.]|nr:ABC transporter permease subunit [Candidatus Vecturithrix sp.]
MKTLTLFTRKHHTRLLTLLAVLVLWQIGVMLCEIKEFILPTPLTILSQLFLPRYALQHQWLTHISTTLSEIVFSFCVTAVVGIFATILMTWSRILRQIITPIIILFNSLPKIALAPLFLLWFGYGIIPNVMIAFLVAFFPIVINTFTGLNAVDDAVASSRNGNLKEVMGGDENFMGKLTGL